MSFMSEPSKASMHWSQVITTQERQLLNFQEFGKPVVTTVKLTMMGIFIP